MRVCGSEGVVVRVCSSGSEGVVVRVCVVVCMVVWMCCSDGVW